MTEPGVYGQTTEPSSDAKKAFFSIQHLGIVRFLLKVLQLLFSFIGFVCEEIIDQCENCGGLYFFEFVSCSAFLLALLPIIVYCTQLKDKVNKESLATIDFWITSITGVIFLIASIVFVATMDSNTLATVSVAFGFLASIAFIAEVFILYRSGESPFKKKANVNGQNKTPEGQPLKPPVQAQEAEQV
ncbi:CKLF-like MARVEL transmembrane domain-containing protein 6 [Xenopus laevis]|uniref:CKLF-like MARVEL transmembrane domain-containing protein 6 n=2 Tax=Xenopus laevis TaxID=8355 RepID=A0A1L8FWF4_XENLA|nr:CKLF-like MARVEL transmembrane domain-containing protein 6 [Xenopus laevis]OCT75904.1 hypothetical protein XELAEV_18031090mg [Xenopus laevis]